MAQATIESSQTAGAQHQRGASSEMMRYYLASQPSTATDRLVQGRIMSDQEIKEDLEQKRLRLEALVKQAKGVGSRPT
ncbi:hypothetical protein F5Y06DRAFT_236943 [Hypoxylon sp. FL0890]|nr:hypothetical protein F5Y06DRAFT_236943 [Hypoxylon sp. FL0890]